MINATVVGNVTKDAVVRPAGSSEVASFNVISNVKVKGEEVATLVQCSMWGARGKAVAQYLTKGKRVAVGGAMHVEEYDGRRMLKLNVSDLDFTGSRQERDDDDFG